MDIVEILKHVMPETIDALYRRYSLLRAIGHLAPVGRRLLAENLKTGERIIRSELTVLKELDLVVASVGGVSLTPWGENMLSAMNPYMQELLGLQTMEKQVANHLGIPNVILVPGDSSSDQLVQRELGKAAARALLKEIQEGDTLAITGGTTMLALADAVNSRGHRVTVVPGRGALGERAEIQASAIAAKLAQALGGHYRLLHAPDNLSRHALEELSQDPSTAEVLALIHRSTLLIHGIGDGLEMAARRQVSGERVAFLREHKAVAEALGYYFDFQGEIVWQANSIGLGIEDLESIKTVIVVAGGKAKARAIRAVAAHHKWNILVSDQGAAEAILQEPGL